MDCEKQVQAHKRERGREREWGGGGRRAKRGHINVVFLTSGSCADIMHSAQPFRNGFKQEVIAVILRDVVQGLYYLHNLGYVHR